VGGAYGYSEDGQYGFTDHFESENDASIYMAVDECGPNNFFQPDTVPLLAKYMADLSKVPNIICRVLGFRTLMHSYTEINSGIQQVVKYM